MKVSQLAVEVLGSDVADTVVLPDGEQFVSDFAGTWGTTSSGTAIFWQTSTFAEHWLSGDSQTGNEEQLHGYIHIPNLTIPAGATINAAYLCLSTSDKPHYNGFLEEANYPGRIYGEMAADPAAVASSVDGDSRLSSLTTAYKTIPDETCDPSGKGLGAYNPFDVTEVLLEILAGGWTSGDAIQFVYVCPRDLRSGGPEVWAISKGWYGTDIPADSFGQAPLLIVSYEVPPPSTYDETGSGGVVCGGEGAVYVGTTTTYTASGGVKIGGAAVATDTLSLGLQSYYPCDEASGNLLDSKGAYHMTDTNTVTAGTGIISGARDFESTNSERFIRTAVGTDPFSFGDTDFTLSIWAKPESKAASMFLFAKWHTAGAQEYVPFYDSLTDRFVFVVRNAANNANGTIYSTVTSTTIGSWHHVVVWHDATNNQLGIQVNGQATTSSWTGGVASNIQANTTVGSSADGAGYWDGLLDNIGVWRRVLTADERQRLWNGGSSKPYPFADTNYSDTATGGAVVGGMATYLRSSSDIGTGGVVCGGTATVAQTSSTIGAGGVVCGGAAVVVKTLTDTATGGVVAYGSADTELINGSSGGVKVGGSATVEAHYVMSADGTATATGVVDPFYGKILEAHGTATVTGSVTLRNDYRIAGGGTAIASGTATLYGNVTLDGSGTASVTGSVVIGKIHNVQASGGVVASGSAASPAILFERGAGGAKASGAASASSVLTLTTNGTASATGTLVLRVVQDEAGAGGVVASGAANVRERIRLQARGTASANGIVELIPTHGLRTYGTATATGVVALSKVHNLQASGGVKAGGSASLRRTHALVIQGTATASGSVTLKKSNHVTASGGVAANGTATDQKTMRLVAHGTASATGDVSLSGAFASTSSGGVKASGSAAIVGNFVLSAQGTATATGRLLWWQHLGQALTTRLKADADLMTLIAGRVYPFRVPEKGTVPAVVYSITSQSHESALDGSVGLAKATIEMAAVTSNCLDKGAIAEAVDAALRDSEGFWGPVQILSIEQTGELDGLDAEDRYVRELRYTVWYRESRPLLLFPVTGGSGQIEEAVVDYLADLAPVYPSLIPRKASLPAIAYERSGSERFGGIGGRVGLADLRMRLMVVSKSVDQGRALADKVRERLHGYTGTMGTQAVYGVVLDEQSEAYDDELEGKDSFVYQNFQDLSFVVKDSM